jgi:hypothetical protein
MLIFVRLSEGFMNSEFGSKKDVGCHGDVNGEKVVGGRKYVVEIRPLGKEEIDGIWGKAFLKRCVIINYLTLMIKLREE